MAKRFKPFKLTAPNPTENAEHEALADALRVAIGEPGIVNADGVLWYSTETRNAVSQERWDDKRQKVVRFSLEGQRRQRCGVVPGMPDVTVRRVIALGSPREGWQFPTFTWHVELKEIGGVCSKVQLARHAELRKLGDAVLVAEGWPEAMRLLRLVGVPMRGMT